MKTKTPDLAAIAAIEDTAERAAAAADATRTLQAKVAQHRINRNMAMLTLIREPHNWTKAAVIALVGVSRSMFVGVVNSEPAVLPEVKNPDKVAAREQAIVKDIEQQITEAIAIRDAAITDLLFEHRWPNHRVAKTTGDNPVRIAQLRAHALV